MDNRLGIYIHIPFCIRKCSYCDFLSQAADDVLKKRYVEALLKEIELKSVLNKGKVVKTVFIGGGTPSSLKSGFIEMIVCKLKECFNIEQDVEFTIECNPGTLDEIKLKEYKACGINRLSIGLQSADNEELRLLGRIHTFEEFEENYRLARELGFDNISIDLMSGLPYQTEEKFVHTLKKVLKLNPEHISAYSLIIEEGTKFFDIYGSEEGERLLPGEDEDRNIYHRTGELLAEYGYERYEISNYARCGYYSRHNYSYWERRDYLGLGCGASSLYRFDETVTNPLYKIIMEGICATCKGENSGEDAAVYESSKTEFSVEAVRFKNISDINEYIEALSDIVSEDITRLSDEEAVYENQKKDDKLYEVRNIALNTIQAVTDTKETELLHKKEAMEEFMFLGLRKTAGILKEEFEKEFNVDFNSIYGSITKRLAEEKLIYVNNDNVRLTEYGMDVCNYVMSEYLL